MENNIREVEDWSEINQEASELACLEEMCSWKEYD